MSFSYWSKAAALALLPVAAIAQQLGPSDANATVPAVGYVSAFESYQTTPEEKATPDQLWRAANEGIGRDAPHAGHGGDMAMPGIKPNAATPRASKSQPAPRAGHGNMAMPGMGNSRPEPKADAAPADPHAGHHNKQGK